MEPTQKRAALDAWLVAAEEVLNEQRQHSISPSSVVSGPRTHYERLATLWEIEHGLTPVLQKLVFDPGRWILIIEDGRNTKRYLQFLVYEDGSLVAETVSNRYLSGTDRWTPKAEATFRGLGWSEPQLPKRPNWLVVCSTLSPPVAEIAHLAAATLRHVFAIGDRDRVAIKLLSSPLRGNTPASESPISNESPTVNWDPGEAMASTAPTVSGFRPTNQPWADYYRSLFPGHLRPRSGFDAWKLATTAVSITEELWQARERARYRWETDHGTDPYFWPVAHPPVVLWVPWSARAGCLACTWIDLRGTSDVHLAGRRARKHSVWKRADPIEVGSLRVPVSERQGPTDTPLSQKWV